MDGSITSAQAEMLARRRAEAIPLYGAEPTRLPDLRYTEVPPYAAWGTPDREKEKTNNNNGSLIGLFNE
jgi:hypothetical protein